MKLPSSRVYGGWLALARLLTGGIWLDHGVPKFLNLSLIHISVAELIAHHLGRRPKAVAYLGGLGA